MKHHNQIDSTTKRLASKPYVLLAKAIFGFLAAMTLCGQQSQAKYDSTDISNTPLATTSDIKANPNIMFVLDDSGSMAWAYMPDDMSDSNAYGYKAHQCNGLAYDPAVDYTKLLPLQADGVSYPHADFSVAMNDGYIVTVSSARSSSTLLAFTTFKKATVAAPVTATVVLSSSKTAFKKDDKVGLVDANNNRQWMTGTVVSWNSTSKTLVVNVTAAVGTGDVKSWSVGFLSGTNLEGSTYYKYKGSQKLLDWKYSAAGSVDTSTTFYSECTNSTGNSSSVFTSVAVNSTSSDAQNYADWYAYYRKRYLMMRSVAGRSFITVGTKYRVGFATISDTTVTPSSTFLEVSPFEGDQQVSFYADLYGSTPNSSTPLRGALSKIGRYYANKASGQVNDPVQYACQRNYTILSTDGYWNLGWEVNGTDASTNYGPYQLDNLTKVGNQDGLEAKPMWDGTPEKVTTNYYKTLVKHMQSYYDQTATIKTVSVNWAQTTPGTSGCTSGKSKWVGTVSTTTETKVTRYTTLYDQTGTYTTTVVKQNGVVQSSVDTAITWGGATNSSSSNAVTSDNTVGPSTSTVTGTCATSPTKPAAPSSSTTSSNSGTTTTELSRTGSTVTSSTSTTDYPAASSNSLADVAEYYYKTDLRTIALGNCKGAEGTDVCENLVPQADPNNAQADNQTQQHMTTFTMGLGTNGVLPYEKNYLHSSDVNGTWYKLNHGSVVWPAATESDENATHIDDLWHAAVNGRGQYWSASDPTSLADAISGALTAIDKVTGSSSAAATTSMKPQKGDNSNVFVATYETVDWVGNLTAYKIDSTTGEIDTSTSLWDARALLSGVAGSARKIYYYSPSGTNKVKEFTLANLASTADGLDSYFTGFCSKASKPKQCDTLTSTEITNVANNGTNLVNYLRGDTGYADDKYYRARKSILGDIMNSTPVFLGKPPFKYADTGYNEFVSDNKDRTKAVYVGANDGMLHAFNATTGSELWAYVPRMVMSNMYRLADTAYTGTNHLYFVDGPPISGDIYAGGKWRSILVGGLNAGGRGYYALDVTDPNNPKALWEFSDADDKDLGLTYGNPIITKRADGTWVVVFSSGYNNSNGIDDTKGDANGHLYVLNAYTGKLLMKIDTLDAKTNLPVGTSSTQPSGLGKINAWVDDYRDNSSKRFYGGDLRGNLWRFDIDGDYASSGRALQLATFQIDATHPQPITTRPETASITYGPQNYSIILVGTGRYLGLSDLSTSDPTQQSIYAIKDDDSGTSLGNVRSRSDLVVQTAANVSGGTDTQGTRTVSNNPVDWSKKIGWQLDLISDQKRERVVVDMELQYSTLAVASAVPGANECQPGGGKSWLYGINILNGQASSSSGVLATLQGDSLIVGLTWFLPTNGQPELILSRNNAKVERVDAPVSTNGSSGVVNRTSWRELVN